MITLLNGRGQLGTAISKRLKEIEYVYSPEVLIYHTWNIEDKQKHLQELELEKFKPIVDTNTDKKIIFISTSSERESWYTHYKQLAESYLLQNCENGFIWIDEPPLNEYEDICFYEQVKVYKRVINE